MNLIDRLYKKYDIDNFIRKFNFNIKKIEKNNDKSKIDILNNLKNLIEEYEAMKNIAFINYMLDKKNGETEYHNYIENEEKYNKIKTEYYKLLIKYKSIYGEDNLKNVDFKIIEIKQKIFSKDICEELKIENRLVNAYLTMTSKEMVMFRGKKIRLSEIEMLLKSNNGYIRQEAYNVKNEFYAKNEAMFDKILDQLIKIRTLIAHKLGYSNFIELGYARLARIDFNEEKIELLRKNILKYFGPLCKELKMKEAQILNISNGIEYSNEDIIKIFSRAYDELCKETRELARYILENNLYNSKTRKLDIFNGCCIHIKKYNIPYIFFNINNSFFDLVTFAHEFGHALQLRLANNSKVLENNVPRAEIREIFSMGMELISLPLISEFLKENKHKYEYYYLYNSISYLAYAMAIDEYQHEIYKNIHISSKERKCIWKRIEDKYMISLEHNTDEYICGGNTWQFEAGIFIKPFDFTNYVIAQIFTLQFIIQCREENFNIIEKYILICKNGTRKSISDLIKMIGMEDPFTNKSIKNIAQSIQIKLSELEKKVCFDNE